MNTDKNGMGATLCRPSRKVCGVDCCDKITQDYLSLFICQHTLPYGPKCGTRRDRVMAWLLTLACLIVFIVILILLFDFVRLTGAGSPFKSTAADYFIARSEGRNHQDAVQFVFAAANRSYAKALWKTSGISNIAKTESEELQSVVWTVFISTRKRSLGGNSEARHRQMIDTINAMRAKHRFKLLPSGDYELKTTEE